MRKLERREMTMKMMKRKNNRIIMMFFTLLMLAGSLLASYAPMTQVQANQSPVMRILCRFEDGQTLANLQSTDYLHYLTRSKSAQTDIDSVESSMANRLLTVAGYDFVTPNEEILGRDIRPTTLPEEMPEVNQGPKVSAFDRFGMSGLRWSSYQGEWKYYHVNACANQNQVSPTNYGAFYENRMEPKSTYNSVSTSRDPRTIQFDRGLISSVFTASKDLVANGMFAITKGIVTLTIAFVGLAFSDVTSLMGMSADGSSGASAAGMFTDIFNSVFTGFILFTFLFTALYLLYNGLVKRQIRMAIGTLIKTIVIFMVAIIISTNPSQWVSAPNRIATFGQALVLSSMAGMYDNDTGEVGLCTTEVASIYDDVNIDTNTDETVILGEFEKINRNMKSLIGCQMWEQLLFRPWVRGQFGAEYEELNTDNINNINDSWVGNASVPLGDGQSIENWALFHLSTQTDAHSQVGDNNFPILVNGVNADWWRVADALSNYHEEETVVSDGAGGEQTFMEPVSSDPTKFWQSWIGNNSSERMGTAFIAIAFGIAGSILPLILAISSAMYGFFITLMMMTSPVFLLLGTWGEKGTQIFMGWLSALINTVFKRIGVSILLVLSLSITMNIMNLAYSVGIVTSFTLMCIVTYLLTKNKNKLLGMLASVDLGGAFDPRTQANKFLDKQNRRAKNVANIGVAATSGAIAGKKTGQGVARGAQMGAQRQLRNTLYQSTTGTQTLMQADITLRNSSSDAGEQCVMCYAKLGVEYKELAYRDDDGNFYCITCAEELGVETLNEVTIGHDEGGMFAKAEAISPEIKKEKVRSKKVMKPRSYLSHSRTRDMMNSRVINDKYYWDNKGVQEMIKDNIERLREDTIVFNKFRLKYGSVIIPPSTPEPLQSYIDVALINDAWANGDNETVERTYKEAWKAWYEDNGQHVQGLNEEEIEEFKKEIEEFNPEIDAERSKELVESSMSKAEREDESFNNNKLYIYSNGRLILNIHDNIKNRHNSGPKRTRSEYEEEMLKDKKSKKKENVTDEQDSGKPKISRQNSGYDVFEIRPDEEVNEGD